MKLSRFSAFLFACFLAFSPAFADGLISGTGGGGGSGTVTSIAPAADNCLTATPNPIVATGTLGPTGGLASGACGGTGVANTGKTVTLGGNLTTSGAFNLAITLTNGTTVTFPTTGTLATLSGSPWSGNQTLTANANWVTTLGGAFSWSSGGYVYSLVNGVIQLRNADFATPSGLISADVGKAKTTNYTVLILDSGTLFTNAGAAGEADFTLPTPSFGLKYTYCVVAAQILKIIATNSATITNGGSATAANGNAQNATVGSCIEIKGIDATHWFTVATPVGTWTLT